MAFVVAVQGYTLPTLPVPVAKRVGAGAARNLRGLRKAPPFAMHMRMRAWDAGVTGAVMKPWLWPLACRRELGLCRGWGRF